MKSPVHAGWGFYVSDAYTTFGAVISVIAYYAGYIPGWNNPNPHEITLALHASEPNKRRSRTLAELQIGILEARLVE